MGQGAGLWVIRSRLYGTYAEGLDILNEFCLWGIYSWQQQQTAYKKHTKQEGKK